MSRRYTAQEMREMATEAEVIDVADQFLGHDMDTIAAMLRQAADYMERERKYEYSQRRHDEKLGIDVVDMLHCSTIEGAISLHGRFNKNGTIVRREVGEWEEV